MNRKLVITVVIGILWAGAASLTAVQAAAVSDNPGRGEVLDFYMKGTHQSINLTQPPQPGQQNIIGRDLYVLGGTEIAPVPDGDAIGRRVGVCTVVTAGEAICDGVLLLDGLGTITVQLGVLIPGGNQGIAVTGGYGDFAGANGTITETDVPGHPNDRVLHVELGGFSQP
ncbi:MAG TPA: hypothetical protein VE569_13510 [Acidimicrobiia bacterium]|jgi:hypothetical protein|nr:hypothetical protein [Acidimicrobiia bacterium]